MNKRKLEGTGKDPMYRYWKVLGESVNPTLANRGFHTNEHVASNEQTKKCLSYFYPKQKVQQDEIHTRTLSIEFYSIQTHEWMPASYK